MSMHRILALLACMAVATLAWSAAAAPAARAPKVHVVVIDEMAFGTVPAGVRAGDIVEWVNHDIFQHTATARDGRFDVELPAGASARTVVTPGNIGFYCKYHPGMTGMLVVAK